ncbi:hypothetical protein CONLIGDRAFT_686753 [Coniochaeta ligniaria NRRL 30616]|uniref:Uncharacterized protein n=1 Tax=Coniochaeta ligniaria NRRL 30616 TaxID=1408157 RepID=A0A1J7IQC8_9PEZI|nr:hypothetical protein CONLIGDRAFT_686753 [Coniochaeta ligniaria NRRL 30616]
MLSGTGLGVGQHVVDQVNKLARRAATSGGKTGGGSKGFSFRKKVHRVLPESWKDKINMYFLNRDEEVKNVSWGEFSAYLFKALERVILRFRILHGSHTAHPRLTWRGMSRKTRSIRLHYILQIRLVQLFTFLPELLIETFGDRMYQIHGFKS